MEKMDFTQMAPATQGRWYKINVGVLDRVQELLVCFHLCLLLQQCLWAKSKLIYWTVMIYHGSKNISQSVFLSANTKQG